MVARWIRSPSTVNSTSCGYCEAAHDVQVGAIELHLEGVLAVERERVTNLDAADGAERQAVEMLILREVLPNAVGVAAGRHARVADRQRADLLGRRQVALLQRRRHAEHVGDIVEAVGRIVGRQQRRDVHVDREHVANRVGVLGAVQAMQHRPAGIGRRGRRPIELALEPADQLARRWRGPDGGPAAAASCRRAAAGRPSPRSRRNRRSWPRSRLSSVIWPGGSFARWLWQVTQYRSSTSAGTDCGGGRYWSAERILACGAEACRIVQRRGSQPHRHDGDE